MNIDFAIPALLLALAVFLMQKQALKAEAVRHLDADFGVPGGSHTRPNFWRWSQIASGLGAVICAILTFVVT